MKETTTDRDLAKEWYARVVWIQHGHYLAALHFTRRHWLLGGLTIIITAVVGTSVFATLAKQTNVLVLLVVTGALSVMATLLSALQTFLSYGERADKHRVAGAQYGVVGRELELMLAAPQFDATLLPKIKEQLDILAQQCPHIPDAVHQRMQGNPPIRLSFERNREQGP